MTLSIVRADGNANIAQVAFLPLLNDAQAGDIYVLSSLRFDTDGLFPGAARLDILLPVASSLNETRLEDITILDQYAAILAEATVGYFGPFTAAEAAALNAATNTSFAWTITGSGVFLSAHVRGGGEGGAVTYEALEDGHYSDGTSPFDLATLDPNAGADVVGFALGIADLSNSTAHTFSEAGTHTLVHSSGSDFISRRVYSREGPTDGYFSHTWSSSDGSSAELLFELTVSSGETESEQPNMQLLKVRLGELPHQVHTAMI